MPQEETQKQRCVILTENNLLKGFITEAIRNCDQKKSCNWRRTEFLTLCIISGRWIRSAIYRRYQACRNTFGCNIEHLL